MSSPRAAGIPLLLMVSAGACSSAGLRVPDGAAGAGGGPADAGLADVAADVAAPADGRDTGQDAGAAVLLETNPAGALSGASLGAGTVAFRLPPFDFPAGLTGVRLFSRGDAKGFGGGGLHVALYRGRPDTGTRLTFDPLGTCPDQAPCWTGPDFPAVTTTPGATDLWLAIDNLAFEGGVLDLPIAARGTFLLETWGTGFVRWTAGGTAIDDGKWHQAPADQPWMLRLQSAGPPVARDGGAGDGGTGDGPTASACPPIGTACTGEVACSQGDPVEVGCRRFQLCQSGVWRTIATPFACGKDAAACGAAPPTDGAACATPCQLCSYPTASCMCETGCERGPDAGPCMQPLVWHCQAPLPSCPPQAPQWGAPCTGEGASCRYNTSCSSFEVRCTGGTWQPADPITFGACA